MEILNKNTVVVLNGDELKEVLEGNNYYNYIYFGNDITLTSGIIINENKTKVTIDGTYLGNRYTYTGIDSSSGNDTIAASHTNKKIIFKNADIKVGNPHGVIYVKGDHLYDNIETIYDNITFNGVELSYNPFGILKIINCNITIENVSSIEAQEVSDCNQIIISGNNNINSSSIRYPLFTFRSDVLEPYFIINPNSRLNLTSVNTEFMKGTTSLDLTVRHDSEFNLITNNGFTYTGLYGCRNVLIEERAIFNFIESGHYNVPMWYIYGTLTLEEDSNFYVINSYDMTPVDNYNIYFKEGSKIIINNPKSLILYNKNANVIHTDSNVSFSIDASRINMWNNSVPLSQAGNIDNLPNYYWYKEENNLQIEGIISSSSTEIKSYNLTDTEIANLFSLNYFDLCNQKQISIGSTYINIHPIYNSNKVISGHTLIDSDVLIEYNGITKKVSVSSDGLFECPIDNIDDNTIVTITSCVSGSFIYKKRTIKVPHSGEITLAEAPSNIVYELIPITLEPIILPKNDDILATIIDSRTTSSDWKLYVHITEPLKTKNNFTLLNAVVFKTLNDEIIILNEVPSLIYNGSNNNGKVLVTNITWSKEKGFLLNLDNKFLEVNEEYNTKVIWSIEE